MGNYRLDYNKKKSVLICTAKAPNLFLPKNGNEFSFDALKILKSRKLKTPLVFNQKECTAMQFVDYLAGVIL